MVRQLFTNESCKSDHIDIFGKPHILDFITHNEVDILLVKPSDFGSCDVLFSFLVGFGHKEINSALSDAQLLKYLLVLFSQRSLYRDNDIPSPITLPDLMARKKKIDLPIQDLLSFTISLKKYADCAIQVLQQQARSPYF